eukprot:c41338_g1_i1 orf=129-287(+)
MQYYSPLGKESTNKNIQSQHKCRFKMSNSAPPCQKNGNNIARRCLLIKCSGM